MLEGWDVMGLADAINIVSATLLLVPVRTVLTFSSLIAGRHGTFINGVMPCVSDLLAGRAGQSELGSRPRPGGAGLRSYEQWRPVMASGFLRDGFDRPTLENCTMVRICSPSCPWVPRHSHGR